MGISPQQQSVQLNYKRTFFIGLAFLSISAFWQMYDSLVPLILKNTFEIGDTLAGVIMAADNVLALFMLPLFGALSDRVRTPIGKRMPFIIGGTAAAVIAMLLIPIADNLVNLRMFVIVLFLTLVAMSTYRSPAVALMPDVTPKPLRSKANGVINLMGAVGAIISLVAMSVLIPDAGKPDYLPIFAIVAGLMVVAVVVLVNTVKENKLVEEMERLQGHGEESKGEGTAEDKPLPQDVRRSLLFILASIFLWFMAYNAVTTAWSKYAQTVLGLAGGGFANSLLLATAAAVLTFIPSGLIATRIGRKRTILTGIVLLFLSFAVAFTFTAYHPAINVLLVVIGVGWALINVNSYPMVVEMAKGSDVGKFTGTTTPFPWQGRLLPILSGALLEYISYRTLFPYAALFAALAFLTMSRVHHGDSRPAAHKDRLEYLNVED